jgi:hypothetical protein
MADNLQELLSYQRSVQIERTIGSNLTICKSFPFRRLHRYTAQILVWLGSQLGKSMKRVPKGEMLFIHRWFHRRTASWPFPSIDAELVQWWRSEKSLCRTFSITTGLWQRQRMKGHWERLLIKGVHNPSQTVKTNANWSRQYSISREDRTAKIVSVWIIGSSSIMIWPDRKIRW